MYLLVFKSVTSVQITLTRYRAYAFVRNNLKDCVLLYAVRNELADRPHGVLDLMMSVWRASGHISPEYESSKKSIRLHLDDVNVNVANLRRRHCHCPRFRERSASGPLATLKVFVGGKGIQKSKRVVDTPLDHLSIGEFSLEEVHEPSTLAIFIITTYLNYNEITILKSRFATPALKLER
ncbi:uncharacterized protein LACBIDRAFT_335787 [Laccaria bicolor S238N-H82]|uniref:Predicted protein n=1 Tax=Laccaria bicolor (strain S238N-H82 / ATCC MYA-4686) TaxID=486041 RepID=B0E3E7_LACBS|nr:uncharacterized protein LACBIDRAFT_335787 [Laccaria bicolor S238N-H82]EDQ98635.1 predicted protein [Laccaria bicolor S238N-H82]|eukprot:XP_001890715.1 predicted protein [Laccaria bicolor S238N-H82]